MSLLTTLFWLVFHSTLAPRIKNGIFSYDGWCYFINCSFFFWCCFNSSLVVCSRTSKCMHRAQQDTQKNVARILRNAMNKKNLDRCSGYRMAPTNFRVLPKKNYFFDIKAHTLKKIHAHACMCVLMCLWSEMLKIAWKWMLDARSWLMKMQFFMVKFFDM